MQDIDHVHHVVHSPSLLTILDKVYACLDHQGQIKAGFLILLLSIFASSTHSWVQKDCERGLFSTSVEANSQSPLWLKVTEDVLDIAHRTSRVSVEGIQGIIIASFVMGNSEGISRRCRSFHNLALLLARELGLHRLDHPSNTHLANTAQAEIGRRVWWYLAASDWFALTLICILSTKLMALQVNGCEARWCGSRRLSVSFTSDDSEKASEHQ